VKYFVSIQVKLKRTVGEARFLFFTFRDKQELVSYDVKKRKKS
jgi:hypothetical protein